MTQTLIRFLLEGQFHTEHFTLSGDPRRSLPLRVRCLAGRTPYRQRLFYCKTCRMVPASFSQRDGVRGEMASFTFKLGLDRNSRLTRASSVVSFAGTAHPLSTFSLSHPRRCARCEWSRTDHPTDRGNALHLHCRPVCKSSSPASFALQVNSGIVTIAAFSLDIAGHFSFDSSLSPFLDFRHSTV